MEKGKMKGKVGGYAEKGTKAPSARRRAAASQRQDHFRNDRDCQILRISSLFKMNVAAAAEGFFRDGGRYGSFFSSFSPEMSLLVENNSRFSRLQE